MSEKVKKNGESIW